MLVHLSNSVEEGIIPSITKYVNGEDASDKGAFSLDTVVEFSVKCSRRLGASAVVLRINKDGENYNDYPLEFIRTENSVDSYLLSLRLDNEFCGGEDGLFYYEFLFLRGKDTIFTNSINNVDFILALSSQNKFRLLVYEKDFETPEWFSGRVMYQIFTDRFAEGTGKKEQRSDAVLNKDWKGGVKQFADYPGAPVDYNEFFGGDLWGIVEKLDYLKELGVGVIYLNPIFEAFTSHKYDTGDYMKVDGMFGGEAALENLIKKCHEKDIRVVLDGVFNHTGSNSKYFNKYAKYDSLGAYQSKKSEFFDWYIFYEFPNFYEAWWQIEILPKLNLDCEACRNFLANKGGVADKYTKMGVDGWRLDVADELNDEFLDILRQTVKGTSLGDGIIIGEVWENAADKIAYGKRRRYFRGRQLDSVMNYPLRNGILSFVVSKDGEALYNILTELYSSYPETVCHCLMNSLGTHDTERILSVLGDPSVIDMTNQELSCHKMSKSQRECAVRRLKLASILQYTVFGVPSVYYGDEVGMEGGHDPFCRQPFPWDNIDKSIREHYVLLGKIRNEHTAFKNGRFKIVRHCKTLIVFERVDSKERILIAANGGSEIEKIEMNAFGVSLITGKRVCGEITLNAESADIVMLEE